MKLTVKFATSLFAALWLSIFAVMAATGVAEEGSPDSRKKEIKGTVKNSDGKPLGGVVVTDGYTCVQTDQKGRFSFRPNNDACYVYYTVPAGCAVNVCDERPRFFEKIESGRRSYDFILTVLEEPETRFNFFCLGDIHVSKQIHLERLVAESLPDIREHRASMDVPCYGTTLGDLTTDTPQFFMPVYETLTHTALGMPLFQLIGNHDHVQGSPGDLASQRLFESIFGPLNYSYDRGDVHFVNMDNIIYPDDGDKKKYLAGFTDAQFEWLRQDLGYVPREKMVILNVHAPFLQGRARPGGEFMNHDHYYHQTLDLLSEFAQAHIVAGHHHSTSNYIHRVNGKEIYEHDTGTVCGAWWSSTINIDGSPNGYTVFEIDGPAVVNCYYKPVRHDPGFQMRMYRASDVFGNEDGDFSMQFAYNGDNQIIANVWNADPIHWTVSVYEDGTRTGRMTLYNGADAWSAAYFHSIGRKSEVYRRKKEHMYYYTLQDPQAKEIRIEAVDRYGNRYTCSKFTGPGPEYYPVYK